MGLTGASVSSAGLGVADKGEAASSAGMGATGRGTSGADGLDVSYQIYIPPAAAKSEPDRMAVGIIPSLNAPREGATLAEKRFCPAMRGEGGSPGEEVATTVAAESCAVKGVLCGDVCLACSDFLRASSNKLMANCSVLLACCRMVFCQS